MQVKSINKVAQKKHEKSLFTLMSETLELANKLTHENIFLMGQSRSGKSTTFNWIYDHHSLIGTGQIVDPVYCLRHKKNKVGQTLAEVKSGYKSVTLIPNIVSLPSKQILVDMPGNCDQRTQFHVLMVSFIYSVFLKHAKKARFIIVITNEGFTARDSAKIKGLVSLFIKLFKCDEITKEQLQQLFKSVSLLVTGVRIQKEQQKQMQSYYCRLLNEKLESLRQIKQSNQIAEIFPYIQMMLENIIKNQRLQLFLRAKKNESPQASTILQKLNERAWSQCQMQKIYPYLQFPYAEQFKKLTPQQQQNLDSEQSQKIRHYEKLQKLLAQLIEVFLQKPFANTYSSDPYQETYEKILQFYTETLIQGEEQKNNKEEFIYRLEQQTFQIKFSPVQILQGILQLMEISSQIQLLFQFQQKYPGKSYFEYLNSFFVRSVSLVIQYFALNQRSQYVLTEIKAIMSERIQCFGYINQLEKFKQKAFHMSLMDYIKIANVFQYGNFDIINQFLKNSNSQKQLKLPLNHTVRVADYLKKPEYQQFLDLNSLYQLRFKIYKLGSQQFQQYSNYQQSLVYNAWTIVSFIKLKLLDQIRAQSEQNKQISNSESTLRELSNVLYKLSVAFLQYSNKKYDQLQQLLKAQGMQSHLNKIYQRYLQERKGQSLDIKFLKSYLQNCLRYSLNNKAQQLYNLIIKHKQLSKHEKQFYREKKRYTQRLFNSVNSQEQTYPKIQGFFNIAKQILKKELTQDLVLIKKFISQKLQKIKQHLQNTNQFTVQLPELLSNYDIIFYSKYLIQKINNRKTIIILGKKTGKSTISYWLRGRELIKNNNNINLKPENIKQSTIKERSTSHTQVPNIYTLNDQQLLVDAPHVYSQDNYKMLILSFVLKQILVHSSESKFILTIKQEDIVSKQCGQLIEMLQFYIRLFKNFKEHPSVAKSLYVVVTFIDSKKKTKVRQGFKKIYELFKQEDNDIIHEKYKLNKDDQFCTRKDILRLLQQIYIKTIYKRFDLQEQKYRNKQFMIDDLTKNQNWIFSQVKSKLNFVNSHLNPILQMPNHLHQKMLTKLGNQTNEAIQILKQLNNTLSIIVNLHANPSKIQETQFDIQKRMREKLTQQWIINLERNQKKVRQLKYRQLLIPKIYKQPTMASLQLFLINRIGNLSHQFSITFQDLKIYIKKIFEIYYIAVGPFLSRLGTIQLAWIKLWEIVSQFEVIEHQTNFQKQKLTQYEENIKYKYGLKMSDRIRILQCLFFNKQFDVVSFLRIFIRQFNLNAFKKELKQVEEASHLLFLTLQEIVNILTSCTKHQWENKELLIEDLEKIMEIQQNFINISDNNKQIALVLLQKSYIFILLHQMQIGKNISQKELLLKLQNIIKIICQKIAIIKTEFALSICDSLYDNSTKQKIFQQLEQKNLLTVQYITSFHQLLIKNGKLDRALGLVDSHRKMLSKSQQQKLTELSLNENNPGRDNMPIREFNLDQLKNLIEKCRSTLRP